MQPSSQPTAPSTSSIGTPVFFGAGLVLPLISAGFYRRAARRPLAQAVLFLFVFGLLTALVGTLTISTTMGKVTSAIQEAFAEDAIPDILIEGGAARTEISTPTILVDRPEMLIAIDTTGRVIQRIDIARYDQGLLLGPYDIHLLNDNGRYQVIPLTQLHEVTGQDRILINSETTTSFLRQFSSAFSLIALISLGFWYTLVRLLYLALVAFLIWGILALMMGSVPYSSVLAVGIYASVPALYLHTLLGLVNIRFFLLHTVILAVIWIAGLILSLNRPLSVPVREPLRAWRTWLGLPMVAMLAATYVLRFPGHETAAWVVSVLTVAALLTEVFFHPQAEPGPAPAGQGPLPEPVETPAPVLSEVLTPEPLAAAVEPGPAPLDPPAV